MLVAFFGVAAEADAAMAVAEAGILGPGGVVVAREGQPVMVDAVPGTRVPGRERCPR